VKFLPEGFEAALALAEGQEATPSAIERVAKSTNAEAARWAFGQWDLRRRAKAKFSRANEMLFVREALEQATHERVAALHASLFPKDAPVADMTAGIGADLVALAARGPVIAFELDPDRAAYARHNSSVHGYESEINVKDSVEWLRRNGDARYAFADPARRIEGRRTLKLDEFSPDPSVLAELFQGLALGVVKLSPMLSDEALRELGSRVEFVSFGNECREALVSIGQEVQPGTFAIHVDSGERLPSGYLPAPVLEPGEFLFDADPAAIRAHGIGTLCERFGLDPLGDSNGYLTGASMAHSPWLRGYRVLYHGKADLKSTRRALRDLGAATPELKQRGAGLDLIKERQAYAMDSGRPVSLAVWKNGKSLRHAILERIATL